MNCPKCGTEICDRCDGNGYYWNQNPVDETMEGCAKETCSKCKGLGWLKVAYIDPPGTIVDESRKPEVIK